MSRHRRSLGLRRRRPVSHGALIEYSFSEVMALARAATRGVGDAWGTAEDAATAVQWLHRQGLDGVTALADLLTARDGQAVRDWVPRLEDSVWTAAGGRLCPLATGAALADRRAAVMVAPPGLGPVVAPMLLMPFIADVARGQGVLTVTWAGVTAVTDGAGLAYDGAMSALMIGAARPVVLRPGGRLRAAIKLCDRAFIAPAGLHRLSLFADRTLAPATAESRARGAGGGDDSLG